jgi:hypothetical protein
VVTSTSEFVGGLTVTVMMIICMYGTAGRRVLRANRDMRVGMALFSVMGLSALVLYSAMTSAGDGAVAVAQVSAVAIGLWFVAASMVVVTNLWRHLLLVRQRRADAQILARMEKDLNS